jgi:hypothetical protein
VPNGLRNDFMRTTDQIEIPIDENPKPAPFLWIAGYGLMISKGDPGGAKLPCTITEGVRVNWSANLLTTAGAILVFEKACDRTV